MKELIFKIGKFSIELINEQEYNLEKRDSRISMYKKHYLDESDFLSTCVLGIKIYQNQNLLNSAIIGSNGGGGGINKNSYVIEKDRLVICFSDSIFCLTIPNLDIKWRTRADSANCFEIFTIKGGYIIHGEYKRHATIQ